MSDKTKTGIALTLPGAPPSGRGTVTVPQRVEEQDGVATKDSEKRIAGALDPGQILESISDAFVAVDRDWRFTYLNAKAEQVFRMRARRLLGRVCWDPADILEQPQHGRRHGTDAREAVAGVEDLGGGRTAHADRRAHQQASFEDVCAEPLAAVADELVAFARQGKGLVETGVAWNGTMVAHTQASAAGRLPSVTGPAASGS
jgi:PAS domain-containing protein